MFEMTTTTDRVPAIFADARSVHADALRLLEAGDIRDAAEKAWCATKRATDALILARTDEEPQISSDTARGLVRLATEDRVFRALRPALSFPTKHAAWRLLLLGALRAY